MKHKTKQLITFLLMFVVVISLICVTGSAAETEPKEKEPVTVASLAQDAKEALVGAPYIGTYCQTAFDFVKQYSGYLWIVLGVLALIECFFGYRLLRIELFLAGLFGGFVGGLMLYPYIENLASGIPAFVELIVAGICAIVAAILVHFLFRVAVFAGVGYLTYALTETAFASMQNALLYRILAAIGCAIIAVLLVKFFFILATGLLGGVFACTQFFSKVGFMTKALYKNDEIFDMVSKLGIEALTGAVIAGAVIGILGVIFQFANTRRRRA